MEKMGFFKKTQRLHSFSLLAPESEFNPVKTVKVKNPNKPYLVQLFLNYVNAPVISFFLGEVGRTSPVCPAIKAAKSMLKSICHLSMGCAWLARVAIGCHIHHDVDHRSDQILTSCCDLHLLWLMNYW